MATGGKSSKATAKPSKPKEMFKPYDASDVPDIMPFPDLALVTTTKSQDTAVPKLNDHQRSWIHDVALRTVNLPGLNNRDRKMVYEQVKADAFLAKAFQHTVQPGDLAEEARLPELVSAWKRKQGKAAVDDGDGAASDQEEDEGGRTGLLRGYSRAGWRSLKKDSSEESTADPAAMVKLLGLAKYTGRDKFCDEHREEILEYSKTLSGSNPGGNFRKAEGLLYAEQDQAEWEAAANSVENVNWKEHQSLVATGFKNMSETLHATGRFRPFVAIMVMGWRDTDGGVKLEWQHRAHSWSRAEAVPEGMPVQSFEKHYPQLTAENLNAMYGWADKALKADDEVCAKAAPVFPLHADVLDDISPKSLSETVKSFLFDSYNAVFESQDIPWATIATAPHDYYDTVKFKLTFASNGLEGLKSSEWHPLAATLAVGAGDSTSGFFRKPPTVAGPAAGEEDERSVAAPGEEEARVQREMEAERAKRKRDDEAGCLTREKEEEEVRLQREKDGVDETERLRREEEAERLKRERDKEVARLTREKEEEEVRLQREKDSVDETERLRREEEEERLKRERDEEAARVQRGGHGEEEEVQPPLKKRGRKRKADTQLVPEDGGATGRPARARKTPKEAELERAQKLAATVRGGGKPSWDYVEKSPVKAARGRTKSAKVLALKFENHISSPRN
ncbi:hypothetical protein DFH09DRAFT_1072468 [Mycena vulgaris]|nr:hypothetical protein DFH09DRAFT_1072468 [Mycena vulgaris]